MESLPLFVFFEVLDAFAPPETKKNETTPHWIEVHVLPLRCASRTISERIFRYCTESQHGRAWLRGKIVRRLRGPIGVFPHYYTKLSTIFGTMSESEKWRAFWTMQMSACTHSFCLLPRPSTATDPYTCACCHTPLYLEKLHKTLWNTVYALRTGNLPDQSFSRLELLLVREDALRKNLPGLRHVASVLLGVQQKRGQNQITSFCT